METNSDKLLFTPGPLTTSATVKAAMQRDLGSRDREFIAMVRDVRQRLLTLAGEDGDSTYTTVIMQGSGTFGIEAVIGSVMPPDGKLLVVINGAYGKRMADIATILKIETVQLAYPEHAHPQLEQIEAALQYDPAIRAVAVVHCETTTGIINPIREIGEIVRQQQRTYIVDAMSSFGAVPINLRECGIHYLVSSSNKCIEGVPGFSFVLADRDSLSATAGYARSLSLDLRAQWKGLDADGQFRFTPPVHSLLAFRQALIELEQEGGVVGRMQRYKGNHATLVAGMQTLGFRSYLAPARQGYIITAFYYPDDPHFDFDTFYQLLSDRGFVLYPGKLTDVNCFRIGNIGRIYPTHVRELLDAIDAVLRVMNVTLK